MTIEITEQIEKHAQNTQNSQNSSKDITLAYGKKFDVRVYYRNSWKNYRYYFTNETQTCFYDAYNMVCTIYTKHPHGISFQITKYTI